MDVKALKEANDKARIQMLFEIEQRRLAREDGLIDAPPPRVLNDWQHGGEIEPKEKRSNTTHLTDWQKHQQLVQLIDSRVAVLFNEAMHGTEACKGIIAEMFEEIGTVLREQMDRIEDEARSLIARVTDIEIASKHRNDATSASMQQDLAGIRDQMGLILKTVAPGADVVPIKRAN